MDNVARTGCEHQTQSEQDGARNEQRVRAERVEQPPTEQPLSVSRGEENAAYPREQKEQLDRPDPRNLIWRPVGQLVRLIVPLEDAERVREPELRKPSELVSA